MAGLDKIISEINDESKAAIAKINADAQAQVDEILADAKKSADEITARFAHERDVSLTDQKSRAQSAAQLQKRQILLAEKQQIISEVLQEAKEKLLTLPDEAYFGALLQLVKKNALPGEGILLLNAKDLARKPAEFDEEVQEIARDKGGSLTISKETRDIDGGFVLIYDGIEENDSITALFEAGSEELQDKVQHLLF